MKQLLFLLLFPSLALAQYQGNGNQKITLGEQTTADGLVWRGRTSDTSNLMTNKLDTSAYLVLDTITEAIWLYRASTTPKWNRVVDSLNNLQGQLSLTTKVTGVLPVANGGTGSATQNFVDLTTTQSIGGAKTFTSAVTGAMFNPTSSTVTGNGMYLAATNTLGFSTANTERLRINSNSTIGINTTSFGYTLMIGGSIPSLSVQNTTWSRDSAKYQGFITFQDVDNKEIGGFGITSAGNNNFALYNSGAGSLRFLTNPTVGSITERLTILNSGNVGIGQTTPTAVLHLKAGTATAGTAPLKFTSGVNLTSPLGGEMEFNGTNLFFSPSTTRHTVNHGLTGSATLDFLSTNAQNSRDMTIAVTGAADGDVVSLGVPNAAVNANTSYSAWVSAANTVTVRFNNYSSGTVDPASGLFKVFVTK